MPCISINWTVPLALIAGVLLAIMTDWNSQFARHSSPLFASWTAHCVGAIASMFLVGLLLVGGRTISPTSHQSLPHWSYLGGIPGAFTVVLGAITVNSALGLAGTLALSLVGQMAFGMLGDSLGFFRLQRRGPHLQEMAGFTMVFAGSIVIIVTRS